MQKWFIFFLLAFCSNQVLTLFKKEESSYCLESELNLLHGIKGKRLSVLKKIKDNMYKHLEDPLIGIISRDQPKVGFCSLAWMFNLFELAPQKGRGVQIGVCDNFKKNNSYKCKKNFNFCSYSQEQGGMQVDNVSQAEPQKESSLFGIESVFFKEVLKNHGLMTCSILKEIAPCANIFPIQVSKSKRDFFFTLEKLKKQNIILHLGLKFTESLDAYSLIDHKSISDLLENFRYVVAAAGNDSRVDRLPYPVRFPSVFFSVGSYEYSNGNYNVCNFSQFEKEVGPYFVAPGKDIVCSVYHENERLYSLKSGTSISSAIVSGFLALLLGEFQRKFSWDEIKYIIEQSIFKVGDSHGNQKVLLGAIDMRTCLLCLHIMSEIKLKILKKKKYKRGFKKLVKTTLLVLKNKKFWHKVFIGLEKDGVFVNMQNSYASLASVDKVVSAVACLVLDWLVAD